MIQTDLRAKAERGDPEAQALLAASYAKQGSAEPAKYWIARSAEQDFIPALRLLGIWEIGGYGGPRDIKAGLAKIDKAAAKRDPAALVLQANAAADATIGGGDFQRAASILGEAAQIGSLSARQQLNLITDDRGRIAFPHERPMSEKRPCHGGLGLESAENLLSEEQCAYVIAQAAPTMKRALVVTETETVNVLHHNRTNSSASFMFPRTNILLQSLSLRIAKFSGQPEAHGEPMSVLHYAPGQEYKPHVDWFDPASDEVRLHGQRVSTSLVYLNEGYRGGETRFIHLEWAYKGATGTALHWRNVNSSLEVEPMSLHAGVAPTHGDKWIISKWFRDKPQLPRIE